jgi:hypothetical protein
VAVLDPDTWYRCRKEFNKKMGAALAALAAGARLVPSRSVAIQLADYDAGTIRITTRYGVTYPLVLLPVVMAAIDRLAGSIRSAVRQSD